MKPPSEEAAGESQPTGTEGEPVTDPSLDRHPEPVIDDGSVPDKQIGRWKDEGGSFQPAD